MLNIFTGPVYNVVDFILGLYIAAIFLNVVFSLLQSFGIINTYNELVATLMDFLHRICEPVLRPVRRILPDLGGIDISPMVVILLIYLVRDIMARAVKAFGLA